MSATLPEIRSFLLPFPDFSQTYVNTSVLPERMGSESVPETIDGIVRVSAMTTLSLIIDLGIFGTL